MLLFVIIFTILVNEAYSDNHITCYYRNWSQYGKGKAKLLPEGIDPNLCSVIKYASFRVNMATNEIETVKPNDEDLLARVNALKLANPSLKIVIAVGGWSHEYKLRYSQMAASVETRRTFINSVVAFMIKHKVDGLSYNWLYPAIRPDGATADEKQKFTLLLKETLEAFKKDALQRKTERFQLTATVSSFVEQIAKSYELPEIANYVDSVDLIVHSLWGYWKRRTGTTAAMKGPAPSVIHSLEAWLNAKMPANKINIGFAIYGRTFNLEDASNHGLGARNNGPGRAGPHTQKEGILAYYEICSMKWDHMTPWTASKTKTPYASDNKGLWVAYDDPASMRYKVVYLMKKYKLHGVAMWALAFDDFSGEFCNGGIFPMVKEVIDGLEEAMKPEPVVEDKCNDAINLGFLLDSSLSVKFNYADEKKFIKSIAASFGISKDGTRAGVITFSYYAKNSIKLNDNFDLYSFNAQVDAIPLEGHTTQIDKALRLAQTVMFTEENGARPDLPNILVLLTDGAQTDEHTCRCKVTDPEVVAEELRTENNITIFSVGVGALTSTHELERIAGDKANVHYAPTFETLTGSAIRKAVMHSVCPTTNGGESYFKLETVKRNADIAFLMDSSDNIGDTFAKQKAFIKSVAAFCGLSKNGSHAGVISFGDHADLDIKLNDYFDLDSFGKALDKITPQGLYSRVDAALRMAQNELFTAANGVRQDVKKVVSLLTDGFELVEGAEKPGDVAEELISDGTKIISIGIGVTRNRDQLVHIAGAISNVHHVDSFDDLLKPAFVEKIGAAICTTQKYVSA